jgi:hypothetical protein
MTYLSPLSGFRAPHLPTAKAAPNPGHSTFVFFRMIHNQGIREGSQRMISISFRLYYSSPLFFEDSLPEAVAFRP